MHKNKRLSIVDRRFFFVQRKMTLRLDDFFRDFHSECHSPMISLVGLQIIVKPHGRSRTEGLFSELHLKRRAGLWSLKGAYIKVHRTARHQAT